MILYKKRFFIKKVNKLKVINVVLKKSTRSFDMEYSYKAEDEAAENLKNGSLVKIPFGKSNKIVDAYVKDIIDAEKYNGKYSIDSLKNIFSGEEKEDLSPEFLALANWMSKRYFCSRAAAIKHMTAPGGEKISAKKVRMAKLNLNPEELCALIDNKTIRKIYQIEILDYLRENGETEVSTIMSRFSVSPAILNTMIKHKYITVDKTEAAAEITKGTEHKEYALPKELTEEQKQAVETLENAFDSGNFSEYLLHGVTGSGKTEIYLNIIKQCIDAGKQAIVLVPEISLTPQMNYRFKGRFGDNVAILHSRLTARERYDQWQLIKQNKVKLVVGARSAIFAPFSEIGVIIIDEEHESTYKSENTPRYHAAEIAEFRCKYKNALLIKGSATPYMDTSYKVQMKKIGYIGLRNRASGVEMPEIKLVDMKEEFENGNREIFSETFCGELARNLKNREQTMILINRRGFSSALVCKNCGYTPKCHDCNTSMTYHSSNNRVICHYCGFTESVKEVCPACQSPEIKQTGFGTQKVENELNRLFPQAKTIRMDMDTTKGRNTHEEILSRFVNENIDILIGTQMIAKGHDFANVTLACILTADAGLNVEDYRASERTFQLITQASGRAGRGTSKGRVVIQAQNIDDYTIQSAAAQDYRFFYKNEMQIRKQLDFPPYTNMVVAGISGENDRHTFDVMNIIKEIFQSESEKCTCDVQVLGPARFPMSKINGKYRWRLIIKCKDMDMLIDFCTKCLERAEEKKFKNVSLLSIDINPMNML